MRERSFSDRGGSFKTITNREGILGLLQRPKSVPSSGRRQLSSWRRRAIQLNGRTMDSTVENSKMKNKNKNKRYFF